MSRIKVLLKSSFLQYLILFLLFLLIVLYALQKTLNFSLFGDDWYIFWILESQFGPGKQFSYFDPKAYTNPWGSQYLLLLTLNKLFGFWEQIYYILSMLLRVFAALTTFSFINYLIKDKFISIIASLFVVVGFAGIEATSSMLHMTTFIAAGFLMLSLKQIAISQDTKSWKRFLLGCLFFAIALASAPIRTHGLLILILLFDVFYWFFKDQKISKLLILREVSLIIVAMSVYKLGFFGNAGPGGNWDWVKIPLMIEMFLKGNFTFITAFITNLGKVFVPDNFFVTSSSLISLFGRQWVIIIFFTFFLVGIAFFWFLSKTTKRKNQNFYISLLIYALLYLLIGLVQQYFSKTDRYFTDLLASWIGVIVFTLMIWALHLRFILKEKIDSLITFVVGPQIILTSLIVPLVFNPGATLDATHRYFALGLTGMSLVLAGFLKMIKNQKSYKLVFGLMVIYLLFNIFSDQNYLNQLYPTRSAQLSNATWNKLFTLLPDNFPNNRFILFYMDDKDNAGFAFNTILFGFPPRMAIQYHIYKTKGIPAFTTSYDEIVSAVTDGKVFKRLGYEEKPISIDQVYAIKFTKDNGLIDITKETQAKLKVAIKPKQ